MRIGQIPFIVFLSLILSTSYVFLLPKVNLLHTVQLRSLDYFLRNRYEKDKIPDIIKKIVVITIDENTLSKLREQWPLNRGLTAYFLEKISTPSSKPAGIGIDLVFTGKSDIKEADLWLSKALKGTGKITLASFFNPLGEIVLPDKLFLDSVKSVGFINSPRDTDFVIRRNYPFVFLRNEALNYSLAVELFANIEGYDLKNSYYDRKAAGLRLTTPGKNDVLIPVDDKNYSARINYLAKPSDFKTVPFWEVLTSFESPETFKDKIVLLGTNMEITHDVYLTPLGMMASIYINANFIMDIMLNRFLKRVPARLNFILLFIISLLIGFVRFRFNFLISTLLLVLILAGGYFAAIQYLSYDTIFDFFGIITIALSSFLIITIIDYFHTLLENVNLRRLAITDGLTGLYVFRYFEVKLIRELRIAHETKRDLSLVIFDIDHFKNINDTYGHDAGNEVLKGVATVLRNRCRYDDTICRFGGEEFVSILPHTNLEQSGKYGEAIRKNIEMFPFKWEGKDLKITISAGCASVRTLDKATPQDLIKAADQALYAAKTGGRNKVILSSQLNQAK